MSNHYGWCDSASRLQVESAGVAAGLGGSLLLEPRDELCDGEGLGEGGARASTGGGRRSRWLLLGDGGWGGSRGSGRRSGS
jgi:hypothetical protein